MQTVIDVILKTQGDNNIRKINRALGQTDTIAKKTNSQLGKTSLAYGKTGKAAKGASAGVGMFGKAVNAALGPIGLALSAVAGLGAAFNAISNQDFAVAKVKSLGVEAGDLNAELKQVSAELNNSASVAQLTGAAYDVASAGFTNAKDAAQVLKAASMGATGGFTDMNTAGDALTSVLNAYGLEASEATATMDKFIQTQNDGKIVVDEYARNIGKVASAAASLGVPLDEVNAIISQSTAAGVQAETAFTGLKTAIARLASGEANKALEEYGVSIDAQTIKSEGLAASLQKIVDAGVDTGTLLKALGTEAGPALLPVLNNLDKFNELLDNQKNSAGAAAAANKLATDTIQGAWKQLTNVFSNFFTEQSAAGDLLKLTLQGITLAIDGILRAVNLALTPFKVLVGIINGVKQAANKLAEGFKAAFDSPEGRAFLKVVELIQQKIAEATQWVGENFKGAWDAVLGVVFEIGKFIGSTLLQAIDKTINGLAAAFGWLPVIGDKIKAARDAWNGLKDAVTETKAPTEEVKKSAEEIEAELKEAQKAAVGLAEAQKLVADEAVAAAEASQQIQKDTMKLYEAEYNLRSNINKIAIDSAKADLDKADTLKEVKAAAEEIFHVTEAQAGLDRDLAKSKADAAVEELNTKRAIINATLTQAEAERAVLQARGEATDAVDKQLNKTRRQIALLDGSIATQEKIRDIQYEQADAIYKNTVAAAKRTKESTIQAFKEKQITAEKRKQTAEMEKQSGLQATINAQFGEATARTSTVSSNMTAITKQLEMQEKVKKTGMSAEYYRLEEQAKRFEKEIFNKAWIDEFGRVLNKDMIDKLKRGLELTKQKMRELKQETIGAAQAMGRVFVPGETPGQLPQYASGGYVNSAQTAVIGEAGPEYVIPANRMDSALANYAAGKRGNAVLSQQVNVTTGPVQQMDGTNYVTLQQATSMSQSAARQGAQMALSQIKSDPGTRRAIGVGA